MFERFTSPAREAVVQAQAAARDLRHDYIGTEHILLALVREGEGLAACLLQESGASAERVRTAVLDALREPNTSGPPLEGA